MVRFYKNAIVYIHTMPSITKNSTLKEYQQFVQTVYGLPNDLHFELQDLLNNVQRFATRGLKGIRKKNQEKCLTNLLITSSFFMSTLNRLHIDIEDELWHRFPYICSYCARQPCQCKDSKPAQRKAITPDKAKKPNTIADFHIMFEKIYPSASRTLEHAGVHMAEEVGELVEAFLAYRGEHTKIHFNNVTLEAADLLSCFFGVLNSLSIQLNDALSDFYTNNCHVCHHAPCSCEYRFVINFKS